MPPHPFNASLCHVIEAGLKNIRRLNAAARPDAVAVEVEHLAEVAGILDRYCLYQGTPRYEHADFDRYWNVTRRAYKARADDASVEAMMVPWSFLAPDYDAFEAAEGQPFWNEWLKRHAGQSGR